MPGLYRKFLFPRLLESSIGGADAAKERAKALEPAYGDPGLTVVDGYIETLSKLGGRTGILTARRVDGGKRPARRRSSGRAA
jgi:hypothetical protein